VSGGEPRKYAENYGFSLLAERYSLKYIYVMFVPVEMPPTAEPVGAIQVPGE